MPELITCPHCGTKTSPSSNLCLRCGVELPDYLRGGAIKCPNCLEITSAVEETCRHCGKAIPEYLLAYHREEIAKATEKARAEGDKAPPPAPKAVPPMEPHGTPQQTEVPSYLFPLSARQEIRERKAATTPPPAQPAPASRQTKPRVVEKEPEPEALPVPAKTRPVAPQAATMKLLIRRNQKSGIIRRGIAFTIDVRAELSPEMLALVKKYKMGKEILFYKEKVDLSDYWLLGPFRQLIKALAARLWNIKITVNDLVKGKHMECKDILEMLEAEDQIREASALFKHILESAAHFGGEEVIEL